MKAFMLVIDGVGDEPLADGRAPLDAAHTPAMDFLALGGETGELETSFEGYPVESLVCVMGLLGYDPRKYYPCGRASFEALAKGIALGEDDLALRCNVVKTAETAINRRAIEDFTAGMISDARAGEILSAAELPAQGWELHPGQGYRNLLIIRRAGVRADEIKFSEPHMHQGEPLENILPAAGTERAEPLASALRNFILNSYKEGYMLWLWSASSRPSLPPFKKLCGKSGAVVAGLDFMRGLALAAGMSFEAVPGATGYTDTDYGAKAEAAIRALGGHDFVIAHVNAADEASHMRDAAKKIEAIESADRHILGPVFCYLEEHFRGKFVIMVCGDHNTRCRDGKHTGDPVPFLIYKDGAPSPGKPVKNARRLSSLQFMKEALG